MTEAGESLMAVTTGANRNVIRQAMGALQHEWDSFYGDVTDASRNVAVNLVEWSSLSDSIKQVEAWLGKMEASVGTEWQPVGTIEEKKSQLQINRVRTKFILHIPDIYLFISLLNEPIHTCINAYANTI